MSNRSTNYHTSSNFRSNPNFRMNQKRPANIQLMNTSRAMPAGWWVLWILMAAAYAAFMVVFMYHKLVYGYGVKLVTNPVDQLGTTGFAGKPVLFFLWTAVSALLFFLFPFVLSKTRYTTYPITEWHWTGLIGTGLLLVGSIAIPLLPSALAGKLPASISAIIASHPWLFKLWGVLLALVLFLDFVLAFEKYAFRNAASTTALVFTSFGFLGALIAASVPPMAANTKEKAVFLSLTETQLTSPRFWAHNGGLLLMALFLVVLPLCIFLVSNMVRFKRAKDIIVFIVYLLLTIAAVVLDLFVARMAIIECIPVYGALLILALQNYTPLFDAPVRGHV